MDFAPELYQAEAPKQLKPLEYNTMNPHQIAKK